MMTGAFGRNQALPMIRQTGLHLIAKSFEASELPTGRCHVLLNNESSCQL